MKKLGYIRTLAPHTNRKKLTSTVNSSIHELSGACHEHALGAGCIQDKQGWRYHEVFAVEGILTSEKIGKHGNFSKKNKDRERKG